MSLLAFLPFVPLQVLTGSLVIVLQSWVEASALLCGVVYVLMFLFVRNQKQNRLPSESYKRWKRMYNWCQVGFNLGMVLYAVVAVYEDWPVSAKLWMNVGHNDGIYLNAQVFILLHAWNKMVDMCDTFFILYEGKRQRLTFLHVYHHLVVMLIWVWLSSEYHGVCRPTIAFGAMINSVIHALMYAYYNLSTNSKVGPWIRQNKLWLTGAQMMQFLIGCIHAVLVGLYDSECQELPWSWTVQLVFLLHMFYLFAKFFAREISRKSLSRKKIE